MYIGPGVIYPSFLPDFNKTWIFVNSFSKNTQISNFMQIRPVGGKLFMQTDGRTDTTKLIVAFHNFANTPRTVYSLNVCHPRYVSTICNNKTIHH
jgi:hypothetical protein